MNKSESGNCGVAPSLKPGVYGAKTDKPLNITQRTFFRDWEKSLSHTYSVGAKKYDI